MFKELKPKCCFMVLAYEKNDAYTILNKLESKETAR